MELQGQIIYKPNKQEVSSMFITHRLNVMHESVNFHNYIPYGLGVMAHTRFNILFVLRFYGPVNPMGSSRAWSVYLTTCLLGRLSPLSG